MAYKKFKLVYGAKNKDIKGSLVGIPAEKDPTIVTIKNYDAKLVYENDKHELLASKTGIPAKGDRVIGTRKELEGMEVEEAPAAVADKKVVVEDKKETTVEKSVAKPTKKITTK